MDSNFLENYDSEQCDIGARLFKEIDGSGCFVGSGTCEGTCEVLADQTECQISVEPTAAPTVAAPVAATVSPTRRPSIDVTQQPSIPPVVERTIMPSIMTLLPTTSLPSLSPEPTFMESEEPSSVPSMIVPTFQPSAETIDPEEKSGKGSKKSSKKGKKSSKSSKSGKGGKGEKSGKGGKGSSKGKKSKSGNGSETVIPALAITMSPTGIPSSSPSTTLEQQRSINEGLARQIVGRRQWRQFLQDVATPDDES